MKQQVLPGLPDELRDAAQRAADKCLCWQTHQTGPDADPDTFWSWCSSASPTYTARCWCDCHRGAGQTGQTGKDCPAP